MPDQTRRDYFDRRLGALKIERQSFIPHYKDLSDFVQPRRGRFETQDRNRGEKRNQNIINSRATQALRTSRAGLLAGTASATRPWFSLHTADPDLMEFQPVKEWLWKQEQLIRAILNQSNFYNMAPVLIGELLLFGTGCMTHVDDFDDVARFYTHPAGSYMIAQNDRYQVDTLVREQEYTVDQLVSFFGLDALSSATRSLYDASNYDAWVPVVHFIEPNPDYNPNSQLSKHKKYRSVWYEKDGNEKDKFLRESGFDEFPAYVPRWDVTGEDVYGTDCPGMTALGDIRSLQMEEKRKAQAIDKMVNPPLKGPPELRNVPINTLPGGLTIYSGLSGQEGLQPVYHVNPQLQDLKEDILRVENRINEAFFVDMFLAISNMEGIQPRNQFDLIQRNEERLLQLGPVLERMHGEFLERLIERVFNQAVRAGVVRNAPEQLQGSELEIKFISSLAMAQKAVAAQPIERIGTFVGQMAQVWPEVVDKFNADEAVDEFASAIGGPPSIIVPDELVAAKRQARAAQQAQAQQVEQGATAAGGVKDLAAAAGSLTEGNGGE